MKYIQNEYNYTKTFCRTNHFSDSLFPYSIREWIRLDPQIKKSVNLLIHLKEKYALFHGLI